MPDETREKPKRYHHKTQQLPKDAPAAKAYTYASDIPTEVYWELLEGTLGELKNAIILPSKLVYVGACKWCREYYRPGCKKAIKKGGAAKCVREALIRETWEALIDLDQEHGLSIATMEAFERILRERDRKRGYIDVEIDGLRYVVKRSALFRVTPLSQD